MDPVFHEQERQQEGEIGEEEEEAQAGQQQQRQQLQQQQQQQGQQQQADGDADAEAEQAQEQDDSDDEKEASAPQQLRTLLGSLCESLQRADDGGAGWAHSIIACATIAAPTAQACATQFDVVRAALKREGVEVLVYSGEVRAHTGALTQGGEVGAFPLMHACMHAAREAVVHRGVHAAPQQHPTNLLTPLAADTHAHTHFHRPSFLIILQPLTAGRRATAEYTRLVLFQLAGRGAEALRAITAMNLAVVELIANSALPLLRDGGGAVGAASEPSVQTKVRGPGHVCACVCGGGGGSRGAAASTAED